MAWIEIRGKQPRAYWCTSTFTGSCSPAAAR
jgi:hypothetical protein